MILSGAFHPLWLYPQGRLCYCWAVQIQSARIGAETLTLAPHHDVQIQWPPASVSEEVINCFLTAAQGIVRTTRIYKCHKDLQKYLRPEKKMLIASWKEICKPKNSKHGIKCLQNIYEVCCNSPQLCGHYSNPIQPRMCMHLIRWLGWGCIRHCDLSSNTAFCHIFPNSFPSFLTTPSGFQ